MAFSVSQSAAAVNELSPQVSGKSIAEIDQKKSMASSGGRVARLSTAPVHRSRPGSAL